MDILTHNDGTRHSGFESQSVETTKGLLVSAVCALQYLHKTGDIDTNTDPSTIEHLADNFSFGEIHKRTLQTKF